MEGLEQMKGLSCRRKPAAIFSKKMAAGFRRDDSRFSTPDLISVSLIQISC